uniref:Uncharacterized protein n=1 Tax=Lygus hesperus TaxID=30085 RepID=A0A146MEM7_LYGHE
MYQKCGTSTYPHTLRLLIEVTDTVDTTVSDSISCVPLSIETTPTPVTVSKEPTATIPLTDGTVQGTEHGTVIPVKKPSRLYDNDESGGIAPVGAHARIRCETTGSPVTTTTSETYATSKSETKEQEQEGETYIVPPPLETRQCNRLR